MEFMRTGNKLALIASALLFPPFLTGVALIQQRLFPSDSTSYLQAESSVPGERFLSSAPSFAGARAAALAEINKKSSGSWSFRWRATGVLAKMSGASYPVGLRAPLAAAAQVIETFAPGLLGVDPSTLSQVDLVREEALTQVVYRQSVGGLPVFGSRITLYLDSGGNLVYMAADIYSGPTPALQRVVPAAAAAASLREYLVHYLQGEGLEVPEGMYSLEFLQGHSALGFRLNGPNVTQVYRYEFSLADVGGGETEALVDARDGSVIQVHALGPGR
jgi:Fungalysin/Thermolysin Propeptide Motif